MASVFDEKCREKEKRCIKQEKANPTIQQVTVNLYNKFLSHDTHCLCYSVNLIKTLYHISSTKKYREKEGKTIWKNIYKKAGYQLGDATSQFQFIYEILTFYFEQ